MSSSLLGRLLLTSAALALSACIGGGDTSVAPTPTPTPPPPPPPPPAAQSPVIFPNITTSTTFAALGLEAPSQSTPVGSLVRDGFAVNFDAASNTYVIAIPSEGKGAFRAYNQDDKYWYGFIDGVFGSNVNVFKPSPAQLAYTSFGMATNYYSPEVGFIAFGSATPPSGIPLSGSATYDANVAGTTLNPGTNGFASQSIGGTATLQFDFGAGTLAGHFDPMLITSNSNTSLGTYTFVNTIYGVGSTSFSGQLSISGASSPGAFDGQFTGPVAQELMARWTAPYLVPGTQQWSQMFGVWVGKKK